MSLFKPTPLLILFLIFSILSAKAQVQVLQKMVNNVNALKSISYHALSKSNSPFSDEKFTIDVQASYAPKTDTSRALLYNVYSDTRSSNNFKSLNRDIYDGKNLLLLVYTDKTYRIKRDYHEPSYVDYSIYNLADDVNKDIKKSDLVITQLPDSMVNNVRCFHIRINTADTVAKRTGTYIHQNLLIRKDNFLPAYCKTDQAAVISKGGMDIGKVKLFSETYFNNYKINAVTPNRFVLKIPAGFQEEKPPLPLLAKGTPAPNWHLVTTNGKPASMTGLKGKVTLLDITAIGCPACMLAIPPLNRLHEKYKDADVAIISVFLDDTKEALVKFVNNNKVAYPVYANGNSIKSAYHIGAIPVFYIIDKQGVISEVYEGFFENFEQEMTSKIEALR